MGVLRNTIGCIIDNIKEVMLGQLQGAEILFPSFDENTTCQEFYDYFMEDYCSETIFEPGCWGGASECIGLPVNIVLAFFK